MRLILTLIVLLAGAGPAGAAPTYRVPYRLSETQHLIVRAKFNGRGPLNFLIDTGAPALIVARDSARRVGLAAGENGWATVDRLEIEGGPVLEKVGARVEDMFQLRGMNALGVTRIRMDGVLGYSVLARFRMEIDLTQPAMTWTQLDFEPPKAASFNELEGGGIALPSISLFLLDLLTRVLNFFFPRQEDAVPATRGFFGMELKEAREGVGVKAVLPGSPAEAAGLEAEDRITAVAPPGGQAQPVRAPRDVLRAAAAVKPGERIDFTVQRGARTLDLAVTAGQGGL